MYIKRSPLGRGNLSFGRRRKPKFPPILIVIYLIIMLGAFYVMWQSERLRPQVMAMIGPTPTPTSAPEELLALAEEAYLDGDLEEAIMYYEQVSMIVPGNMEYLFDRARMLTLTAEPDNLVAAIAIADEMILLDPEDPRGHTIKARALDWQGEYDQAVLSALQAIELDPNYALAHGYLGEAYTDLGRFRQAREQLELALQLDPYDLDIRRNYANLLEYYGDYQGAIQQYIQALTLHANLLDLWYGLARNYRGSGQTDLAVETYSEILVRTPDDPLPWLELGRTYFEVRDDAAAQESFQQALSLYEATDDEGNLIREKDFFYLRTLSRLAMVYFTRRNYEDSIDTFEHAIEWGLENDIEVPIEAYYVTASAYYYLDACGPNDEWDVGAVERALEAFEIFNERDLTDTAALDNILSVFVLCRDYAEHPVVHRGPDFENGFPIGYTEPNVIVTRGGEEPADDESTDDN